MAPWHYLGGDWSANRYRRRTGYDPIHVFGQSLFPVHVGPLLRWVDRWGEAEIVDAIPRYCPSWCNWMVRVPVLREVTIWNLLLILRKRPPVSGESLEGCPTEPAREAAAQNGQTGQPAKNRLERKKETPSHTPPLPLRHPWRHSLRRAKNLLGHEPLFLPVLLRLTPLGTSRQITGSTDLVIEGFPRSGNTFTTFAIEDASSHELTIASHVHQPSQIKLALARRLPTVLVVRDPVSALASYLVYDHRFSASEVIGEYCSYHRELVPYAERLLVCEFDEVTSHISSVIRRINLRYSLRIPPFDEDPSNVERVLAQIERQAQTGSSRS